MTVVLMFSFLNPASTRCGTWVSCEGRGTGGEQRCFELSGCHRGGAEPQLLLCGDGEAAGSPARTFSMLLAELPALANELKSHEMPWLVLLSESGQHQRGAGGSFGAPPNPLTSNIFSMSVYLVFSSSPQEVRLQ